MTQENQSFQIIEEIQDLIEQQAYGDVKELIGPLHPADLADIIEQMDNYDERLELFKLLDPESAGNILKEVSCSIKESISAEIDDDLLARILEKLHSDDATDLINILPRERAQKIIKMLPPEVSEELKKLIDYEKDTAGGLMALEFVSVNSGSTVGDAIEYIRKNRDEVQDLYYVWVVNNSGQLAGSVSLKDLVLEPQERYINDIMNAEITSVYVEADQEEVARIAKQYGLIHVPVINGNNRLVGRITNDDIIGVIEEENNEDISLMAGVFDQEITEGSAFKISRSRMPWLLLGLLGGLVSAVIINLFHGSLEKIIALSFFIPVVMAMGGNTGIQAATVVTRGLATGDIRILHTGRRLLLELWVSLINGILCGMVLGFIVGFWLSDIWLGLGVGISLITVILFSGSFGAFIPFMLGKLDIDPALATGPFITTSNDILGLLIYLSIITKFMTL